MHRGVSVKPVTLKGMSDVLHANIFFFITAIAVVLVTVMVIIALYYVIRILRAVRDVAERVREGSEVIAQDAANFREGILSGSFLSAIYERAAKTAGFSTRKSRRRAKQPEEDTDNEDSTVINDNEA